MSRARTALAAGALLAGCFLLAAPAVFGREPKKAKTPRSRAVAANFDVRLPVLGTHLSDLPPGPAKSVIDQACLLCHSTDMLRQQRLTEKQWTAEVDKMVKWGSDLPQDRREALIAYLVANFGPDNDRFQPVITRPVGK
ncbi:MAG TPA: cytochrome c [Thermoanaerobaculia bacterium]|nr:cytochrome c [Thermoanaerobaculia bacterium]